MATVPHVSSAESLFDSNAAFVGEGIDVSHSSLLPPVAHSSSTFQTSICLDFQDKYGLERSLPSYSSNFQLAGSSSAWEHNDANSDTHFFTSNGNATTQVLTMQPHLAHSAGSSSQHEILNNVVLNGEWQQMGDMTAGFAVSLGSVLPVCTAPAMGDGGMRELIGRMEGGLCGSGGAPSLKSPMRLSPTNLGSELGTPRSRWSSVDTGNHGRQGSSTTPHCSPRPSSDSGFGEGFIPFGNGNTSHLTQTFTFAGEGANHVRSGVAMPLCQSDASKLPLLETKIEASVDTCGAKSIQDTSQVLSESVGKEVTGRKRKTSSEDKLKDASCVTNTGVKNADTDEVKGKRQKSGEAKEDTKQSKTERSSSDNSGSTSAKSVKENTKPPEPPKDYIHVRARRGQATDSHSLAERVRREKISERMKFLQDLVPGCNKVTGKAVMLDEIINYVQSLQRQVEFLSMKLAAVNPRLEFNMESLLSKEMAHGRGSPPSIVMGPQAVNSYTQQLHHSQHSALQAAGLDLRSLTSLQEAALRRGSLPCIDPYVDSVSQTSSVWDGELQNLVHMMGFLENSHVQVHPCHLSTDQLKLKAEL